MHSTEPSIKPTHKENYRQDIDGLRAIAVIGVVLYHLEWDIFQSGYVGVDVFFVISGFLITSLIFKEYSETKTFSFYNFYYRRFKRLYPAFLVTLVFCFIISSLLFSPEHFQRFGGSVINASTGLSNFFFWLEAGYFDPSTSVKPLLHTWSLSVEAQFYLLWPITIIGTLCIGSRIAVIVTIMLLAITSIYLNISFIDGHVGLISSLSSNTARLISNGAATIFYLMPFRLYEFAIGGLLVILIRFHFNNKWISELLSLLGILLILLAYVSPHTGTLTRTFSIVSSCAGTVLIIYSANHSFLVNKLLSSTVLVKTGTISYSLYLVHWPVIVFWKYYYFHPITTQHTLGLLVLSYLLAVILYKYVEKPFKTQVLHQNTTTSIGTVLLLSSILLLSYSIWKSDGWSWRVDESIEKTLIPPSIAEHKIKEIVTETEWSNAYTIGKKTPNSKNILVIGDSHADHMAGGAKYIAKTYKLHFTFHTFAGCPPVFGTYKIYDQNNRNLKETRQQSMCREQINQWEKFVKENKFDYVFLSSRWNWLFEPTEYYNTKQRRDLLVDQRNPSFTVAASKNVFSKYLKHTIETIHDTGARAVVFGQVPHSGIDLQGCNNVPRILFSKNGLKGRCNYVPRDIAMQRSQFSNKVIQTVTKATNALNVLPTTFFCSKTEYYCLSLYHNTRLKDDDDHINPYGSVFLFQNWESSDNFPF